MGEECSLETFFTIRVSCRADMCYLRAAVAAAASPYNADDVVDDDDGRGTRYV